MRKMIAVAACLTLCLVASFAQNVPQSYVVINGKDHPEQIDDATAYIHFFGHLSKGQGEPQDRYDRRRRAYARQTGLAENELSAVFAAVDLYAQRLQSQVQNPLIDITIRKQIAVTAMAQLQQALGAHGAFLLRTFIDTAVKPSITIYNPITH